ncbi:MAG: radical SAM protein, partial [Lachnospiraceae bacterium]|nr:radical SAM protein [Lachnospiraceae bacterium]
MNKKQRIPLNGTFELTGRCNLGCKMCLIRVNQKKMHELKLRERTASEWIHMAEQAKDAGTLGLLLTGGEIMLRTDFCKIYEAIAQMGFLLTIYTNATMVTDEIMELLRRYPPHKIGVTMYGASNATYQRLCGCCDGYDRFVDGVSRLTELDSLFEIRTTIVKDNLEDLSAMRDFVKQKFGQEEILHVSRMVVNKIRNGISCPQKVRLTPDENIKLIYPWLLDFQQKIKNGEIEKPQNEIRKLDFHNHNVFCEGKYLFENCGAGINEYAISWSGRMYACELLDQGFTEPFKDGFKEAWAKLPEKYPNSHIVDECRFCKYAKICDSCPANRLAETGDWFGIPEYACKEASQIYQILSDIN